MAPGQPFDVRLRVATAGHAPSRLGIAVAVYPCLSSISAFDQSLGPGGPGTPVTTTRQPVPLTSLPSADGVADLSMPVVVRGATSTSAPFTIDLVPANGQCQGFPSGVFPVRLQLVDLGSAAVLGSLVTHLVYSEVPATQRLRVAVVLPLQVALGPAPATAEELAVRPSAALDSPAPGELAALTGALAAVAGHPAVPVTLSPSGQALEALSAARRTTALDQLSTAAADSAHHQVLFAPFVPVDAAALVTQGLGGELAAQVERGAQLAAPVTHQSPAPQSAAGLGTWVSAGSLDADAVTALAGAGYRDLVVPPTAVAQPPTDGSAAEPFTVSGAHGVQLRAVAGNADLTARFAGSATDPVLSAHQLVAEL
ncbi:MAG TPA: hypothetical protein VKW77_04970, partial [Acidimicrobiales bacterium]|nr:hypothetical protein [Acidimicrobiales bacterium]